MRKPNTAKAAPEAQDLRQRAAHARDAAGRFIKRRMPVEHSLDHTEQVEHAGLLGDVLAVCGINHRDGTVSYADATGKVVRRPMAHWLAFTALQMHSHVQHEIGRRRMIEAVDLTDEERAAWEARIRRELRSDAVHALAFRHDRAFEAAQALRTGAEPASQELRERSDAELLALAPAFEAAVDLYQQRTDEENAVCAAANDDGWPGPAPKGSGAEWRAWYQQKEEWRERTGVAAAEEASAEAGAALFRIQEQIADLSAASLAGLRLKARVAQRSEDICQEWVVGLGEGLVRDILAFTETQVPHEQGAAELRLLARGLKAAADFDDASVEELAVIHEKMRHLSDVTYAMAWQGCCQLDTAGPAEGSHNVAGRLLQWLGEALTDVERRAADELQRRRPDRPWDRRIRLAAIAAGVIENGDTTETATFIAELATFAAEQVGR